MAELNKKRKYLSNNSAYSLNDKLKGDVENEIKVYNLTTSKKYNIGGYILPRVLVKIVVDYVGDDLKLGSSDIKVYVKLYEDNLNKVDWNCIYANIGLLSDFFERYLHKFTKAQLKGFCEDDDNRDFEFAKRNIIDKISDEKKRNRLMRNCLINKSNISLSFLESIANEIDDDIWNCLCMNPNIPFEFFERRLENCSEYRKCEFLANYAGNKIPWTEYERYIEKFNKRQRNDFFRNADIPIEFLEQNLDKIDYYDWHKLCENHNIPFRFFEKHIRKLDHGQLQIMFNRKDIPMDFFNNNFDTFELEDFYVMTNIPADFLEKQLTNLSRRCWSRLCGNSNIPIEFFDKHIDKLDEECWHNFCENHRLPIWFIEKYLNKLNQKCWLGIFFTSDLPPDYFKYCLENKYRGNKQNAWRSISGNENVPRYYKKRVVNDLLTNILYPL